MQPTSTASKSPVISAQSVFAKLLRLGSTTLSMAWWWTRNSRSRENSRHLPTGDANRINTGAARCRRGSIQEMIRDLVRHHVAITSTLPVFETFEPSRASVEPRVLAALLPASREGLRIREEVNLDAKSPWKVLLKKEMQFERDFVSSGGLLLAGEDPSGYGGNLAGFGDQRELELLVEAGFTPMEAIHIATSNGATFLEESDRIGTLAPGKQADLVIRKGDPSS